MIGLKSLFNRVFVLVLFLRNLTSLVQDRLPIQTGYSSPILILCLGYFQCCSTRTQQYHQNRLALDLRHDTSRNSIHRHDIGICRYNIGLRLFATPLPRKEVFIRQCFASDI